MVKQIRDPDARQRIVDAARQLVGERGVHAATMRAIADGAGVSTGAVTHYFTDKADVMAAVLRWNTSVIAKRISVAAADKRGIAALEAVLETLLPTDDEMLQCWTVLIGFWGHPTAQRFISTEGGSLGYEGLHNFVVALLQDATDAGELTGGIDVEHEAERFLALIGGIGLMLGGFRQQRELTRKRAHRMLAEQIALLRA